mmetsp:Transcript_18660/g.46591  ORF Transcript_18660/g.46591 Transcript_18660/m.46591 type:complete len:106 (-) Transcript_18660:365-682(-)|eukprot:CAMPEP_0178994452 /NCGR_PEP_ID=MMETSP0795-20121207/7278_1 /TAXON_ID=88552 /ORGANISM="Amoebophrya sp., Strain Ameob2" /LENGTH=105 /DNA_ID=CAMNT_0020686647 /DNA_START=168 /DNA_END=485 /DNA_ORIENTATION=+
MAQDNKDAVKEEFRTLWGARILWPSDMPDDIMEDAVKQSMKHLEGKNPDKDGAEICSALKEHFDEKWGLGWIIVCGKNFGSYAVHEQQKFIYFYIGQHAFMFYKV